MASGDPIDAVEPFNFDALGELFSVRGRKFGSQSNGYRRFERAADAIRFVIEEMPQRLRLGTYLEVDGSRFDGAGIRRLYDNVEYPLVRRIAA
jgi:NAD(P)H-nitrite reductase large subunit